ncbi:gluconate 2-dehydrogenase subunit 3 family protein [Microbacterium sp. 22242]|uniref:gluconate 2-dehydrogenase subunit 3 family protein n=1 Tax=Microbacterium sp. 22242 TaxID=3453896 RepID=UPI003F8697CE
MSAGSGTARDDLPERFPGFHVLDQAPHWDDATRAVVEARTGGREEIRFFDTREEGTATALFDLLLDQDPQHRLVPVTAMVDARLADGQTDGWHYDCLPEDGEAWRTSLAALDDEAQERHQRAFAACDDSAKREILESVRAGDGLWRGLDRAYLWSLWTRYACTAFYSHPAAWDQIGFAGPAFPRGYKNLGVDRREPFEVADTRPDEMPQVQAQR